MRVPGLTRRVELLGQQAGIVVMWIGLPQLPIFPLVPILMRRIDARLLLAFGLAAAYSDCFYIMGLALLAAMVSVCLPRKPSSHKAPA